MTIATPGRKGAAFDKCLILLLLVTIVSAGPDGLSQGELDTIVMALGGLFTVFAGGNVGEHFAQMRDP